MTERFIFCKGERLAFQTISLITSKYDAQVFPHLRIKEVANRDWIREDEFDYALKGHVDFTIAQDFKPLMALELDGKFHQSEKARERDRKKDAICESLGIPLVRLDSGFMRAELLQPVLAELVDIWLSNCEMRALEFAHLHFLSANWMQLEETVNFNRDAFEIAEDAEWHLEMVSESHEGGYSSARVELVFPNQRVEIGRGRAKVPQRTKVCGRFLAERIAAADAGAYIRTIGGTVRDTMTETKLPLEASCEACAARLAAMTPPEVKVEEGGSKGASAGSGGGKTISSGAQLPPAAPLPRQILHKHVACRAERPPGVTGPEIR